MPASHEDHDEVVRRSFEDQRWLFAGPDSPFAQRMGSTLAWLEPLDAGMVVLDVACGAGHVAEAVAPAVRQVVGIDLTRALLDLGAERMREAGVANVLLQEGQAAALPFVDDSFDLVLCRSAVHHFADPPRVLAQMARVCRPGGRVAVSDMVVPDDAVRDRFDDLHRALDPSHARTFRESELADLVKTAVGPLTHAQTSTVRYSFGAAMTDQVLAVLHDELAGGPATGFRPAPTDDGGIDVAFSSTALQAVRPS